MWDDTVAGHFVYEARASNTKIVHDTIDVGHAVLDVFLFRVRGNVVVHAFQPWLQFTLHIHRMEEIAFLDGRVFFQFTSRTIPGARMFACRTLQITMRTGASRAVVVMWTETSRKNCEMSSPWTFARGVAMHV